MKLLAAAGDLPDPFAGVTGGSDDLDLRGAFGERLEDRIVKDHPSLVDDTDGAAVCVGGLREFIHMIRVAAWPTDLTVAKSVGILSL